MARRITDTLSPQDVVALYTQSHLTMAEIGQLCGVSRAAVHKLLRKLEVPASASEHATAVCAYCGESFDMARKRWRSTMQRFCCAEHYYASLNKSYRPWRQGQRLARAIVCQHFALTPDHVVHHRDGDNRNNDRANLLVYASQADHMAAHRGKKIRPLWDGATT